MRTKHILTSSIIAILCLYLGFTFYSRWRDNRVLLQRLEERRREQQPQIIEAYRGRELKIVFFYASPGTISKGHSAQLCYGVINSEKVHIDPPVQSVWPAVSYCVEVTPKSTTSYRLTAEDAKGNRKTAETTVEVL